MRGGGPWDADVPEGWDRTNGVVVADKFLVPALCSRRIDVRYRSAAHVIDTV